MDGKGELRMKPAVLAVVLLALGVCTVNAQGQANPIAAGQKFLYTMAKSNIVKSAAKMPEENYSFNPTPEVRSFGQLLGHIADSQYMFCSVVLGKPNPAPGVEKSKTSKADLVKALDEAFAFCDAAYDSLTDAQAGAMVKFFGGEQAKATVLSFNTAHNNEHYGNIVTYLRMKGIVPPSSEGR
jgi:uncharacterized damage-inducible protein DinB